MDVNHNRSGVLGLQEHMGPKNEAIWSKKELLGKNGEGKGENGEGKMDKSGSSKRLFDCC